MGAHGSEAAQRRAESAKDKETGIKIRSSHMELTEADKLSFDLHYDRLKASQARQADIRALQTSWAAIMTARYSRIFRRSFSVSTLPSSALILSRPCSTLLPTCGLLAFFFMAVMSVPSCRRMCSRWLVAGVLVRPLAQLRASFE